MQTQLSLFEPDQAREKLANAYDLLSALEGGSRALEAHSRGEKTHFRTSRLSS